MECQAITVGDIVRTRKNDSNLGVLNGNSYVVRDITDGFMRVQSTGADGSIHVLPKSYVQESVQLGYALTVHASQSMTVDAAHLLVTGATDGAGVYVGLTRGRFENHAYFIADSLEEACEQFIAAVGRNRVDAGLGAVPEGSSVLVSVDKQGKVVCPDFGQVRAEAQEKMEAARRSVRVLGSRDGVVAIWVATTDSVMAGHGDIRCVYWRSLRSGSNVGLAGTFSGRASNISRAYGRSRGTLAYQGAQR